VRGVTSIVGMLYSILVPSGKLTMFGPCRWLQSPSSVAAYALPPRPHYFHGAAARARAIFHVHVYASAQECHVLWY
jgi:hypothetical protein